MHNITEAPVFQLTFDLLKDYHIIRNKFHKMEKYTLGEKTENSLLAILIAITEAGRQKREWKISHIEQAIIKLSLAQVLFRLSYEIKIISEKQYLNIQERLFRIGQMLGGWKRSL